MFAPTTILTVAGMLGVLSLCPLHMIAWRFVRMVSIITFALCASIAGWALANRSSAINANHAIVLSGVVAAGIASVALITLAPLLGGGKRSPHILVRLLSIVGSLAAWLAGLSWATTISPSPSPLAWALGQLGHTLSGFLLGSITVGWLLGHRYLTATEMSIAPLRKVSQVILLAMSARWVFLFVVIALMFVMPGTVSAGGDPASQLLADWFMLTVRIGTGLVVPSIFVLMAWDCVKLRSTQSATGILFFASILIVIGELTSRYLYSRVGQPV